MSKFVKYQERLSKYNWDDTKGAWQVFYVIKLPLGWLLPHPNSRRYPMKAWIKNWRLTAPNPQEKDGTNEV